MALLKVKWEKLGGCDFPWSGIKTEDKRPGARTDFLKSQNFCLFPRSVIISIPFLFSLKTKGTLSVYYLPKQQGSRKLRRRLPFPTSSGVRSMKRRVEWPAPCPRRKSKSYSLSSAAKREPRASVTVQRKGHDSLTLSSSKLPGELVKNTECSLQSLWFSNVGLENLHF